MQEVSLDERGSFKCLPCFVKSPSELWVHAVQRGSDQRMSHISDGLNDTYRDVSLDSMNRFYKDNFCRGQLVCARYEDNYYRAEIVDVRQQGTLAEVFYIDFGNREVISINEILPLPLRFRDTPGQAIKCCLYSVVPATQTGTKRPLLVEKK